MADKEETKKQSGEETVRQLGGVGEARSYIFWVAGRLILTGLTVHELYEMKFKFLIFFVIIMFLIVENNMFNLKRMFNHLERIRSSIESMHGASSAIMNLIETLGMKR